MTEPKNGLALLREPFPDRLISKLPKPTCPMDEWKQLQKGKCKECGGWHATSKTIHLDYVGHAALTDRLLDADPNWLWEPMALTEHGLPRFDDQGGLWIKLTVCGVSRLGYGNAGKKAIGDPDNREKEIIGDALRNAAMRFGAALELWHKGQLHDDGEDDADHDTPAPSRPAAKPFQVRATAKPEPAPIVVADLAEPFELVEEAVSAIHNSLTEADLQGTMARIRASKFQGEDLRIAQQAWKDRQKLPVRSV